MDLKKSQNFINGTRKLPDYVYVVYPKVPNFDGIIVNGIYESYNCTSNFCNGYKGNSCCGIRIKMSEEYFNKIRSIFPKIFLENTTFGRVNISVRYNKIFNFAEFEINGYESIKNYDITMRLSTIGMKIKEELNDTSI